MIITLQNKKCTKCGVTNIFDSFYKEKNSKDGLKTWCKECCKKQTKIYVKRNREEINRKKRAWARANQVAIVKRNAEYYKSHAEDRKKYNVTYQKQHSQNHCLSTAKYHKKRRSVDIGFRLIGNLRIRIKNALKNNQKKGKTLEYLGCSIHAFRLHMEIQFQEGMSWDNYGGTKESWSIDHILPCSSFDHSDEEQIKKCWHYSNMQPMWHAENLKKGNRII